MKSYRCINVSCRCTIWSLPPFFPTCGKSMMWINSFAKGPLNLLQSQISMSSRGLSSPLGYLTVLLRSVHNEKQSAWADRKLPRNSLAQPFPISSADRINSQAFWCLASNHLDQEVWRPRIPLLGYVLLEFKLSTSSSRIVIFCEWRVLWCWKVSDPCLLSPCLIHVTMFPFCWRTKRETCLVRIERRVEDDER
jgi:hypothetical protein